MKSRVVWLLLSLSSAPLRAEPGEREVAPSASTAEAPASSTADVRANVSGLLQIDWVALRESSQDEVDPATGQPLNQERFALRRGLMQLDLAAPWTVGRFELEATTGAGVAIRPRQAWLGLQAERDLAGPFRAIVQLGLQRIPFGADAQEPLTELPWLEHTTMVRALFPGQHDLGAGGSLEYHVFRFSFALMNGEPLGEAGAFAATDPNDAKDLVGRAGVDVPLSRSQRLRFGTSWLSGKGFHAGTRATKDRLTWHDNNENGLVEVSELSALAGTAATPSREYSRFALGADATLGFSVPHLGPGKLRAEIIRALNLDRGIEPADPVARGRDLRELGYSLGLSQALFERWELAVRYDSYEPDADATRYQGIRVVPRDTTYRTLALAASLRLDVLRLLLEYDYRENSLGRDAAGRPTTLADDSLTLRGELRLP